MSADSIRLGDVDLLTWGEGDEVVVLLHASATGPRALTGLAQTLGRSNRKILAPAFAGYGQQPRPDAGHEGNTARNLAIALTVLTDVPARRRVVFGHSMGGLIALLSALELEARNQAPSAVVVYEPILHDVLDPDSEHDGAALMWDREVIAQLAGAVRGGDAESGVRRFVEAWNEVRWQSLPVGARKHLVASAANLIAETQDLPGRGPDRSDLARLTVPCLLMRGDRSPDFTQRVTAHALAAIPAAREIVFADCGHMTPVTEPQRVAAYIEQFLEELECD